MKKVFRVLILVILTISLTGCVKINVSMDIKKDKSMDFAMIMALDSSYFDDSQMNDMSISKEDLEEYKKRGFSVENYTDGSMKGYRLYKHIKNIDEVSSTEDVVFDLENQDADSPMFKVEKGLFKNKYIAVFAEMDASNLSSSIDNNKNFGDESDDDYDFNYGDYDDRDYNYGFENNASQDGLDRDYSNQQNSYTSDFLRSSNSYGNNDFSQMAGLMMKNMDMSFIVNLPYSAKSNNATSVNNDGKELKWDLTDESLKNISFEFELYNMINIYLMVAIVVVFLLLVIFIILKRKKNGPSANVQSEATADTSMLNQKMNDISNTVLPMNQGINPMPEVVPPM
ncbi:MAG: hypothetical protein K2M17_04290, partial [Bacilli bacterium]|nr:hypothetical protein [Bacilli bacterium]